MFFKFVVQRDSVRCLTLLIVADGGLLVRFESSTRRELLTIFQLFRCASRFNFSRVTWDCEIEEGQIGGSDVPHLPCLFQELNQTRGVIASSLRQNVHHGKPFIFNANRFYVLIYSFQVILHRLREILAQRRAAPPHL
jgi:hypothetical protein